MGPNSSDLQTVLSQGWLYRGEGNANLVLSLTKRRQILRIRKVEKPTTILQWFFEWLIQMLMWDHKRLFEYEIKNLKFYNYITIPLLGKAYVHPAINISTERKEIYKLDQELMPFRPAHRKHKQLQYGIATLFKDYAFLPEKWNSLDFINSTYAVEIKPKQGWIPFADRYLDRCQFCLNQNLKLQSGKIKEISAYCPLDLFSGDKERMTKALKSLIFSPQNNFKVFKDGIHIYGESVSIHSFYDMLFECFEQLDSINRLTDQFCNLIIQALLKEINYETKGCVNCDNNNVITMIPHDNTYVNRVKLNKCTFNATKLPQRCVLNKILSMQKLNEFGLNKFFDIYRALTKNKMKFDDWSYVGKLLQEIKLKNTLCPKCIVTEYTKCSKGFLDINTIELLDELHLVPYLLAAVANDCSFMVTFRKIKSIEDISKDVLIGVDNWNFLVNIGIFDLYPKPASTILKHVKRNIKLQNANSFTNML